MTPLPDHSVSARSLVAQAETSLAFTNQASITASTAERTANSLLQAIKQAETKNLHRDEALPGCGPGESYWHMKRIIEESDIAELAKEAPKGALLHCHFDAMLPPAVLLGFARDAKNLFLKVAMPLDNATAFKQRPLLEFATLRPSAASLLEHADVFSKNYSPGSWMRYSVFLEHFPGGQSAAENWIAANILFPVDASGNRMSTVDSLWIQFNQCFSSCRGLMYYESAWRESFRSVVQTLVQDNVHYAEIRIALHRASSVVSDDGENHLSHHQMLQILYDTLNTEKRCMKESGVIFHGLRVIYATLRNSNRTDMQWCIDDCIELKKAFPDFLCGFDMCGQEDAGQPLSYWVPELLKMRNNCDDLNLHLPFIFHAGETLKCGGDSDDNVMDAIVLGTKRIGHGFSIAKHPVLVDLCKKKDIAIEVCPISNEMLGLCTNIRTHPVWSLLAAGIPCTINSDDPGFFDSSLSREYYQIMVAGDKMNFTGWRVLMEWSLEYSISTAEEKQQWKRDFREAWERFCEGIVKKYA